MNSLSIAPPFCDLEEWTRIIRRQELLIALNKTRTYVENYLKSIPGVKYYEMTVGMDRWDEIVLVDLQIIGSTLSRINQIQEAMPDRIEITVRRPRLYWMLYLYSVSPLWVRAKLGRIFPKAFGKFIWVK